MYKLSKRELIHLLQKEIKHNEYLALQVSHKEKEISRLTEQWNIFQFSNNVGSVNAWISIEEFFETNKEIQPYYDETRTELANDGCYSMTIVMTKTIEKLLEKAIEYDD